jgi:SAM-dependent methyltransferase
MPHPWPEAAAYGAVELESRKVSLHPWLRAFVRDRGARRVLDFGAGDGALFGDGEVPGEQLWLYEPSAALLDRARARLGDQPGVAFSAAASELPAGAFDLAVCSLVWMMVPTEAGLRELVRQLHASLAEGGWCLVAVTHPCFRQHRFSTFAAEFAEGSPFDYLREGTPFRVRIEDGASPRASEFTDYHWSLAATVNRLLEGGFRLERLVELGDRPAGGSWHNRHVPPYLVLVCRKEGTPG